MYCWRRRDAPAPAQRTNPVQERKNRMCNKIQPLVRMHMLNHHAQCTGGRGGVRAERGWSRNATTTCKRPCVAWFAATALRAIGINWFPGAVPANAQVGVVAFVLHEAGLMLVVQERNSSLNRCDSPRQLEPWKRQHQDGPVQQRLACMLLARCSVQGFVDACRWASRHSC